MGRAEYGFRISRRSSARVRHSTRRNQGHITFQDTTTGRAEHSPALSAHCLALGIIIVTTLPGVGQRHRDMHDVATRVGAKIEKGRRSGV